VRAYCAGVFFLACALMAVLASHADFSYVTDHPVTFAVLAVAIVIGEMLPVRIPRRGNDEQITLSTSFAMALLLAGGLGPAVVAQGAASVIQDLHSRKPAWRVRFNLGQYTLSMIAAEAMMVVLDVPPRVGSLHPFSSAQLPAMLLGASVFFVINTVIVGIAVAFYQGASVRTYFGHDPAFVLITGVVMLMLAPIVLAAAAYSVVLVPLCLAPIMALYNAMAQGERSAHEARHDPLTGLPNRTAFRDAVRDAIARRRSDSAVLLVDLDRFKDVNDALGHRYGDLLLEQVAARFREVCGSDDQIARLGGDEFAVLSPDTDRRASYELAGRIGAALEAPFELELMEVDVQASIGIALCPEHASDVEVLLQKADVAMYHAKETATAVAVYDEGFDHHSPAKLALTAELRSAIGGGGIVVWYQPELDLTSGRVVALEALARWEHPRLGLLRPSAFIQMAERTNLMRALTDRVIDLALAQAAVWSADGLEVTVAVNVSAKALMDPDFTRRVVAALRRAGVKPGSLKLEVTESALMRDPELARSVLSELNAHGVEISIDDFGTGYSSLAYLAELPVSEVKIDQSFVRKMVEGSNETIIVNSTIDLAHHLNLRAVAEGVEDPALLDRLEELGCDAAQGHAIGHPMEPEIATQWLVTAGHRTRPELVEQVA
jgi:diguanylate cyclase (GGDEF)-like protein